MNRSILLIAVTAVISFALAAAWGARNKTPRHTLVPRPAMPRVLAPADSGEPGAIELRAPRGLRYSSAVVSSP